MRSPGHYPGTTGLAGTDVGGREFTFELAAEVAFVDDDGKRAGGEQITELCCGGEGVR